MIIKREDGPMITTINCRDQREKRNICTTEVAFMTCLKISRIFRKIGSISDSFIVLVNWISVNNNNSNNSNNNNRKNGSKE